jgi:hypothetical protein
MERLDAGSRARRRRVTEAAERVGSHGIGEVGRVATVDADGAVEAVDGQLDRVLVERWPETFGVLSS